MKTLRRFYHFLGGVRFAVTLIASTGLFVILGTLLESATNSHRYAATFTYASPAFTILLGLFFVNILVAALRRWPFRRRHIPFLITHLGLLMLLAGAMGKQVWGLQGTLSLVEGSGSHKLLLSDSHALEISALHPGTRTYVPITPGVAKEKIHLHPLELQSIEWRPSSFEELELWIKGSQAHIHGLEPIEVTSWTSGSPLSTPSTGELGDSGVWAFQAYQTPDLADLAIQVYLDGLLLEAVTAESNKILGQIPLQEALNNGFIFAGGKATAALHLDFSPLNGFGHPKVTLQVQLVGHQPEILEIALSGPQELINTPTTNRLLGSLPVRFDLRRQPTIVITEDAFGDNHLWSFDTHGSIRSQQFRPSALDQLIAYHSGFGGYAVESDILPATEPRSRLDREKAMQHHLATILGAPLTSQVQLIPPLELWVKACQKTRSDPATSLVEFMSVWDSTHRWLLTNQALPSPLKQILEQIDWSSVPADEVNACRWMVDATKHLETQIEGGDPLEVILRAAPASLQNALSLSDYIQGLTAELFAARSQLPMAPRNISDHAALFTAYLRAYGVHLQELASYPEPHASSVRLETTVTRRHVSTPPKDKLEDNLPLVVLAATDGTKSEKVPLTFDRYATGLRWPILGGHYLVRFQPMCCAIPYHVRLHDARQVNYPNGSQPFSFEATVTVTDQRSKVSEEAVLSMNQVHETWDGYRFYLANIVPGHESGIRQVQVIVNHDPYKYWLTYPGALALSLGILLLFGARVRSGTR